MSIPKVIHYCWFGKNEKSELIQRCIASWKKYCPDYEIIEWNEDNIDVNFCNYSKRAYEQKRWGFVPDPLRFKIIYDHGGIYLDTDAELIAPLDPYLNHKAFFGYSTSTEIGSGLGFGAEKGNPFIKTMLDHYANLPAGTPFKVSSEMETPVFHREFPEFYGNQHLKMDQILGDDILIIWNIWKFEIHHYTGYWQSPAQRFFNKLPLIPKIYRKIKNSLK